MGGGPGTTVPSRERTAEEGVPTEAIAGLGSAANGEKTELRGSATTTGFGVAGRERMGRGKTEFPKGGVEVRPALGRRTALTPTGTLAASGCEADGRESGREFGTRKLPDAKEKGGRLSKASR